MLFPLGSMVAWAAPEPAVFADKYLVIVATERTSSALDPVEERLRAVAGLEPIRLTSTAFTGLRPCYELLVAKGFPERAEAAAYADKLKGSSVDAYVRATGAFRPATEQATLCEPPSLWIVDASRITGEVAGLRAHADLRVVTQRGIVADCGVDRLEQVEQCDEETVATAVLGRCSAAAGIAVEASTALRTFTEAPASSVDIAPLWAAFRGSEAFGEARRSADEVQVVERVFGAPDGAVVVYLAMQPELGSGVDWVVERVGDRWADVVPIRSLNGRAEWVTDVGADGTLEIWYQDGDSIRVERGGQIVAEVRAPECGGC